MPVDQSSLIRQQNGEDSPESVERSDHARSRVSNSLWLCSEEAGEVLEVREEVSAKIYFANNLSLCAVFGILA